MYIHNQKKIIFHAHCNLHKLLLLIRIIEFNVCMHVTLIKFIEYLELTVLDWVYKKTVFFLPLKLILIEFLNILGNKLKLNALWS